MVPIETLSQWANQFQETSNTLPKCYFKFRIGASNDLFGASEGKVVIKAIPDEAVRWLIVTLPELVVEPDVMKPTSASFKWLPRDVAVDVPTVTYQSFRDELNAWYSDFTHHVQGRTEDESEDHNNSLELLETLRENSHTMFKMIDHYLSVLETIKEEWFPMNADDIETPIHIVELFRDEDDEFSGKLSNALGEVPDDLSEFNGPSLDSFEDFVNDTKFDVLQKLRDLITNRSTRHELPAGWIKGQMGSTTYFMNVTETGQTIQYHSPLIGPTADQKTLTEADPNGNLVLEEIKKAIAKIHLVFTGDEIDTTNVTSLNSLIKMINDVAITAQSEKEDNSKVEAYMRGQYDLALTSRSDKASSKIAQKIADETEATRILKIVEEIEADLTKIEELNKLPWTVALTLEKSVIAERAFALATTNNFTTENAKIGESNSGPKTASAWRKVNLTLIRLNHHMFLLKMIKQRESKAKAEQAMKKAIEQSKSLSEAKAIVSSWNPVKKTEKKSKPLYDGIEEK